jgi:hypothetical protein
MPVGQRSYEQTAAPVDWQFTRSDLDPLPRRLEEHEHPVRARGVPEVDGAGDLGPRCGAGLALQHPVPWPGLLPGRPLAVFGGWSPQLLDDEMPTAANVPSRWPQAVVNDLNNRYFAESAAQIGTEETNDFIFGPLQNALRQALYDEINNGVITEAIPLGNLPNHPVLRKNPGANAARLRELLGNPPGAAGLAVQALRDLLSWRPRWPSRARPCPGSSRSTSSVASLC